MMKERTVKQATGRSKAEWFDITRQADKSQSSHKEIAAFLHETHAVSSWWAQEITVEFEKKIGRRILGQTQDGLFQIGVSKTIAAPAEKLWTFLQSPSGIDLIISTSDADHGLDQASAGTVPRLMKTVPQTATKPKKMSTKTSPRPW